jgi:ribosomal protein L32
MIWLLIAATFVCCSDLPHAAYTFANIDGRRILQHALCKAGGNCFEFTTAFVCRCRSNSKLHCRFPMHSAEQLSCIGILSFFTTKCPAKRNKHEAHLDHHLLFCGQVYCSPQCGEAAFTHTLSKRARATAQLAQQHVPAVQEQAHFVNLHIYSVGNLKHTGCWRNHLIAQFAHLSSANAVPRLNGEGAAAAAVPAPVASHALRMMSAALLLLLLLAKHRSWPSLPPAGRFEK